MQQQLSGLWSSITGQFSNSWLTIAPQLDAAISTATQQLTNSFSSLNQPTTPEAPQMASSVLASTLPADNISPAVVPEITNTVAVSMPVNAPTIAPKVRYRFKHKVSSPVNPDDHIIMEPGQSDGKGQNLRQFLSKMGWVEVSYTDRMEDKDIAIVSIKATGTTNAYKMGVTLQGQQSQNIHINSNERYWRSSGSFEGFYITDAETIEQFRNECQSITDTFNWHASLAKPAAFSTIRYRTCNKNNVEEQYKQVMNRLNFKYRNTPLPVNRILANMGWQEVKEEEAGCNGDDIIKIDLYCLIGSHSVITQPDQQSLQLYYRELGSYGPIMNSGQFMFNETEPGSRVFENSSGNEFENFIKEMQQKEQLLASKTAASTSVSTSNTSTATTTITVAQPIATGLAEQVQRVDNGQSVAQ